jgi:hypothetical protein
VIPISKHDGDRGWARASFEERLADMRQGGGIVEMGADNMPNNDAYDAVMYRARPL